MNIQKKVCTPEYCIIPVRANISDRNEFLTMIRTGGERYGVTIVCLNREMIAGFSHAQTALDHAIRAWKEKDMIARTLEVEVLLYAAGTRQTGHIGPFGPEEGKHEYYLCIIPPNDTALLTLLAKMEVIEDEDWDQMSDEKRMRLMSFYGISPEELELVGHDRLLDLICERSALLTVNR